MSRNGFFRRIIRYLTWVFERYLDEPESISTAEVPEVLPPPNSPENSAPEAPSNPITPQRLSYEPEPIHTDNSQPYPDESELHITDAQHPPTSVGADSISARCSEGTTIPHAPITYEGTAIVNVQTPQPPAEANLISDFLSPQAFAFPDIPPQPSPYEDPDHTGLILHRLSWDERRYPQNMEDI